MCVSYEKQLQFAVAVGEGDFPFDMLRYDECWPATESDSRALVVDGRRAVRIAYRGSLAVARWKSFGWFVYWPYPMNQVPTDEDLRRFLDVGA